MKQTVIAALLPPVKARVSPVETRKLTRMDHENIPYKLYAEGMRHCLDIEIGSGKIGNSQQIKHFMSLYHMEKDEYAKKKLQAFLTLEEVRYIFILH